MCCGGRVVSCVTHHELQKSIRSPGKPFQNNSNPEILQIPMYPMCLSQVTMCFVCRKAFPAAEADLLLVTLSFLERETPFAPAGACFFWSGLYSAVSSQNRGSFPSEADQMPDSKRQYALLEFLFVDIFSMCFRPCDQHTLQRLHPRQLQTFRAETLGTVFVDFHMEQGWTRQQASIYDVSLSIYGCVST